MKTKEGMNEKQMCKECKERKESKTQENYMHWDQSVDGVKEGPLL
jgi:hypothetical protein